MKDKFSNEWFKFVLMLLGIVFLWVFIIFICDKVFHKSFEQLKYIHYFIFFAMLMKAKKLFLKRINKEEQTDEKIESNEEEK